MVSGDIRESDIPRDRAGLSSLAAGIGCTGTLRRGAAGSNPAWSTKITVTKG